MASTTQILPVPSSITGEEANLIASPPQLANVLPMQTGKVMIVDDEPINIKVVRKYLSMVGYTDFVSVTEAGEAFNQIVKELPDVLLLDVMMPNVSGLEILEQVRADRRIAHIPVLILTASDDQETKKRALESGATDFLSKPVDPNELIPRVKNALVVKAHHDHLEDHARKLERLVFERTKELIGTRLAVVHCLARAAEYRDNETGRHVLRVGAYVGIIARELGLSPDQVDLLELASPLHDVGKIGIRDEILLKPGKLDPEEFEIMQKHCALGKKVFQTLSSAEWEAWKTHMELGAKIIGDAESPLIKTAASIALTHHEKWDGTGYPLGLAGEDIPIEGRITAVADVFDALSSKRPYKPPFPCDKCFAIMEAERGKHFDARILDAFMARKAEIVETQIRYADLD